MIHNNLTGLMEGRLDLQSPFQYLMIFKTYDQTSKA